MSFLSSIADRMIQLKSYRSNRKLLIIESDDWGSRRTDNVEVRKRLNEISSAVTEDPFTQKDNLETRADLDGLINVLGGVRDIKGNPACFTMNVTTANPDFQKIWAGRFENYFFEPFHETILNTPDGRATLELWKKGVEGGFFQPQLHGREHLHALAWLKELQLGNTDLLKAFDQNSYGIPYRALFKQRRKNLQAALDTYGIDGEYAFQISWLKDSAEIFKRFFGFQSKSFIAPAYIWSCGFEAILSKNGIAAIQGLKLQYEPLDRPRLFRKRIHYMGETAKSGVIFLTRNVFFEPFSDEKKDWVDQVLHRIDTAFKVGQPAIIGTHRINYVGSLCSRNRDKSLLMLTYILKGVLKKWPEVEFISSHDLTQIITGPDETSQN